MQIVIGSTGPSLSLRHLGPLLLTMPGQDRNRLGRHSAASAVPTANCKLKPKNGPCPAKSVEPTVRVDDWFGHFVVCFLVAVGRALTGGRSNVAHL